MANKDWEQVEGESSEAYARFLMYRNLGPARSLDSAFQSQSVKNRNKSASGQWREDSTKYNWRERAARWDVYMLSQTVPETASFIFEGIKEFARLTLQSIQSGDYTPKNWAEVRDSLVVLASFVSPEIITSAVDNSRNNRDEEGGEG